MPPDIFLYQGEANPSDVKLRDPTVAGAAAITGTLAGTLPQLTGAAAADHGVTSTEAGTLPSLTGAFAGNLGVTGTEAGALPGLTGAVAGDLGVSGQEAGTLAQLTGAFVGDHAISGVVSAALPQLTADLAGDQAISGTDDGVLPALTGDFAGTFVAPAVEAVPPPGGSRRGVGGVTLNNFRRPPAVVRGSMRGTLPGLTGSFTIVVEQIDFVELDNSLLLLAA